MRNITTIIILFISIGLNAQFSPEYVGNGGRYRQIIETNTSIDMQSQQDVIQEALIKMQTRSEDVDLIVTGDSYTIGAHNSLNANPEFLPIYAYYDSWVYRLWDKYNWGEEWFRYDAISGDSIFTTIGTFGITDLNDDPPTWDWDDRSTRVTLTKYSSSDGCSVAFDFPTTYRRLTWLYRKDKTGAPFSVAISGGDNYLEVYNGSAWVEANAYTGSMDMGVGSKYEGNTNISEQLKFRIKQDSATITDQVVTITNTSVASEHFMFWGLFRSKDDYMFNITNIGRGAHVLLPDNANATASLYNLAKYIETDLYDRECDLLIHMLPMWNMGVNDYNSSTINPDSLYNRIDEAFYTSDTIAMYERLACPILVLNPSFAFYGHSSAEVLDSDGNFKKWTANNNRYISCQDLGRSADRVFQNRSDVAYLSLYEKFTNDAKYIYKDNLYNAVTPTTETGWSLFDDDGVHINDNGRDLYFKYINSIFDFKGTTYNNLELGEFYTITGTTVSTTPIDTYRTISGLDKYIERNISVDDSVITVESNGYYFVAHNESFTHSVNNTVIHISVFINDVENESVEIERKVGTANDLGASSASGYKYLRIGDTVKLKLRADNTGTVTISHMTFTVKKVN